MAKHSIETRGSTLFTELSYDDKDNTLIVDMINFGRYSYRQVPVFVWQFFKQASSYGVYYNTYIKGVYQFTRLR
jgi:hypothetical protein